MDISNTLWCGILGLFRCCGVIRKQSRENLQGLYAPLVNRTGNRLMIDTEENRAGNPSTIYTEENYQPSRINLGPSAVSISAEILDSKSRPLRILDEVISEDGEDLETYYIIQHERRSEEKIAGSPYVLNKLCFEHYRVSRTEMIGSSIGWDLLVERGLQLSPPNSSSCLKTTFSDNPTTAQLLSLDSVIMKLT